MGGGLFQGEGSITWCGTAVLQLKMTDEVVVRHFAQIAERGKLYGPDLPSCADGYIRKPLWVWRMNGYEACREVIERLWPWLSPRRRARASEVVFRRIYSKRFPGKA